MTQASYPSYNKIVEELESYLRQNGVQIAYLFGSRARGTFGPESDWDLALGFEASLPTLESLSRLSLMERELSKMLDASVDLVDLEQAHLTLLYECLWQGRCLFSPDEDKRIAKELEVRRRFEDYQHIQSFYTEALRQRLEAS